MWCARETQIRLVRTVETLQRQQYSCLAYTFIAQTNSTQRASTTIHAKPCFNFAERLSDNKFLLPSHSILFHISDVCVCVCLLFMSRSFFSNTHFCAIFFREEVIYTRICTSFSCLWHKLNYFTLLTKFCKIFSTVAHMRAQNAYRHRTMLAAIHTHTHTIRVQWPKPGERRQEKSKKKM